MPHVKGTFKAGQRVVLSEVRGWLVKDGLTVGDVGTVRLVNGELGVEFDRLGGIFVRYAPGAESLVVNCCDVVEKRQECPESRDSGVSGSNPWDGFWKAVESRKKARKAVNGMQIGVLVAYFSEERVQ